VTDPPQLTVAIPTCNGTRHLADTLRSIPVQAGSAFDLLISDDRSDDETVALARAEAGDRARIAVNSERLGLAGNWNRCVNLSRTPLVAIFHQDDVMHPGHLAAHLATFAAVPRLGMVASAADVIDDEGRAVPESVVGRGGLGPVDRTFGPAEAVAAMAAGNPLRCSAVTLRAEALADVGGFDPSLRYVLDWDAWLRIARRWPLAWLARPSVSVRWHSSSETHRFKTGTADLDETARLVDDLFHRDAARWPDAPRIRRAADRRLARAFLNRSHEALKSGDPTLARRCLKRALARDKNLLGTIAADPRLALQMAALVVAPRTAARWFARPVRP
jgi:glycosyltransferase involved in cell wall biosynthesis